MTSTRRSRPLAVGAGRRIAPRPVEGERRGPRRRRMRWLLVAYGLALALVVGQLVRVQVVDADEYADRGIAQRARSVALPATRGRIYDREGDVVATSVDAAAVYADPRAFERRRTPDGVPVPAAADARDAAARLAPLLGVDATRLAGKLRRADGHFVYLARQLDWSVGQAVAALELPGIGVVTEPKRVYPGGPLAGHVIGFTDIDGAGLAGLELQHEATLAGVPGQQALERAPGGLVIASGARELVAPQPGTDLVLTLDREIQHAAERAAAKAVDDFDAAGASIVVLEVGTGEVLAMANAPAFDPNDAAAANSSVRRNRAVTDQFEPGSVQKAITAAAAIEAGAVTPASTMMVPDRITVGSERFSDSHDHPTERMTFADVIEQSSNVGTIMVAQRLGAERLAAYLDAFGYGHKTGIGFPGEGAGMILPVADWWDSSLPTIAIGQGVAVTLLQAADAYATLANDGVAVTPHIVRGTVGPDGRLAPGPGADQRRVVSAATARQVRDMLASVVTGDAGTGAKAAVEGYQVGGKTGTARKPREGARGYSGEYIAAFTGFAPVDDPRIVVAVMVDEPDVIWGGSAAAPAFSEVTGFTLRQLQVPPGEQ